MEVMVAAPSGSLFHPFSENAAQCSRDELRPAEEVHFDFQYPTPHALNCAKGSQNVPWVAKWIERLQVYIFVLRDSSGTVASQAVPFRLNRTNMASKCAVVSLYLPALRCFVRLCACQHVPCHITLQHTFNSECLNL